MRESSGNVKRNGAIMCVWVCATHGRTFGNNFDKDSHIGRGGRHVLAWFCSFHGPEVP